MFSFPPPHPTHTHTQNVHNATDAKVLLFYIFPFVRLKMMRVVEALESKGCRVPIMTGEAELAEKLALITRQVGILPPLYLNFKN